MSKAGNILTKIRELNEASTGGFDPKHMGLSNSPAIETVDGMGYIAMVVEGDEVSFEVNPDYDDDRKIEYADNLDDALKKAKKLGMKFKLNGIKAFYSHIGE